MLVHRYMNQRTKWNLMPMHGHSLDGMYMITNTVN